MKFQTLRPILTALLVLGAGANATLSHAAYPERPITVLVPFSPGGNVDLSTRIVAQFMAEDLGQSILVQNRPGAGGLITYEAAAKANPDGYTLATMAASSLIVTPRLVPRDDLPLSAFTAIGAISESPMVLVVPVSSPYQTAGDFLKAARKDPDSVSMGHSGNGTTGHVAILSLETAADVDFNIIPYKGAAPALVDLMGAQLDSVIDQVTSSLPHVRSGKLRALAVLGRERLPEFPGVPTLQEVGVDGYEAAATTGLIGPAGLPADVVEKLHAALNKALADPSVQSRFRDMGSVVHPLTSQQFLERLQREDEEAANLAKLGILKPE